MSRRLGELWASVSLGMRAASMPRASHAPWTTVAMAVGIAAVTLLLGQPRDAIPLRLALLAFALLPWLAPRAQALPRTLWAVGSIVPAAALYLRGDQFAAMFLIMAVARVTVDSKAAVTLAASAAGLLVTLLPLLLRHQVAGVFWAGGVGLGLFSGWTIRRQHVLMEQLEATRAELDHHALADERRRIARDVHDLVAHSLTVVMLQMTAARLSVRRDPRVAEEILAETEQLGRQALVEVRRLVGLLRDDESAAGPPPGAADLPALVSRLREAGMDVQLDTDGDLGRPSASAGLVIYRVAQEALSNAARHAAGAAVRVRVEVGERETRLCVRDWGAGAGRARAALGGTDGHGLAGMRERAALAGGSVRAGPADPGWEVECLIPT